MLEFLLLENDTWLLNLLLKFSGDANENVLTQQSIIVQLKLLLFSIGKPDVTFEVTDLLFIIIIVICVISFIFQVSKDFDSMALISLDTSQ